MNSQFRSGSEAKARKDVLWMVLLLAAALGARMLFVRTNPVIEVDGVIYATLAGNLTAGKGFLGLFGSTELIFPPLYPLLIAGIMVVTGDAESAARWVSIIAGTMIVVPVFGLARRMYGRWVAWAASVLTAFYPLMLAASTATFSEMTFTLFVFTAVAAAWWGGNKGLKRFFVASGILFGLGHLVKPQAMFLMAAVLAASLVLLPETRNSGARALAFLLSMLIPFLLVIAPYVAFLYRHTGKVLLEGKSSVNYHISRRVGSGMNFKEAAFGLDNEGRSTGILPDHSRLVGLYGFRDTISTLPALLRNAVRNLRPMVKKSFLIVFSPVVVALVAIGWTAKPWDRWRLECELFLAWTVAALVGMVLALNVVERYFPPMAPFVLIWTARGMRGVVEWFGETSRTLNLPGTGALARIFLWILVAATITSGAGLFMATTVYSESKVLEARLAGLWLLQHTPPPRRIMAGHSPIAYYARGEYFLTPYAPAESLLKYARRHRVEYLAVDERYLDDRPQIARWIDPSQAPPGLELLHKVDSVPGGRLVIYKIKYTGESTSPGPS
ncbi:MAG: glycosyltransferase family 39 protein [Deltaproteobacteria bacterium]|nr:glycosyltransferase family 39 protein [Deltaproteobacteria bacterium]